MFENVGRRVEEVEVGKVAVDSFCEGEHRGVSQSFAERASEQRNEPKNMPTCENE